ncbi:hypothetical protein IAT40_004047 [Kwoniella sp. CBS 6097]
MSGTQCSSRTGASIGTGILKSTSHDLNPSLKYRRLLDDLNDEQSALMSSLINSGKLDPKSRKERFDKLKNQEYGTAIHVYPISRTSYSAFSVFDTTLRRKQQRNNKNSSRTDTKISMSRGPDGVSIDSSVPTPGGTSKVRYVDTAEVPAESQWEDIGAVPDYDDASQRVADESISRSMGTEGTSTSQRAPYDAGTSSKSCRTGGVNERRHKNGKKSTGWTRSSSESHSRSTVRTSPSTQDRDRRNSERTSENASVKPRAAGTLRETVKVKVKVNKTVDGLVKVRRRPQSQSRTSQPSRSRSILKSLGTSLFGASSGGKFVRHRTFR